MRNISIEIKMIVSVIFFTLLIVGVERYQLSQNIVEQFIASKKSKNQLLINTISPIIAVNLSLGLDDANKEYLGQIVKQNADLASLELTDARGNTMYRYVQDPAQAFQSAPDDLHYYAQAIADPLTEETYGMIKVHFDNHEYQSILDKNRETTYKLLAITFIILSIFILLIKREFKFLKELSRNVLVYDPKLNNFTLEPSDRSDEVGTIHNAIIAMVTKIHSHSKLLDDLNQSLERKIQERTQELERANEQLKELSITDPLTQLSNRRHFETHLNEVWELAKRNHADISIILCDIDYFKSVNDMYGHIVGDVVLIEIARILKRSLTRSTDFIARYGGEEFIIVLFNTKLKTAEKICSDVQHNLGKIDGFEHQGKKTGPITLSFGISHTIPDETSQAEELIKSADTALYQAKENGRNRIVAVEAGKALGEV